MAALVALAGLSLLWGCGSSTGGAPQPTPSASATAAGQAPVSAYLDTGSGTAKAYGASGGKLSAAQEAELAQVHLVRVGIGAGGQYIAVQFKAPPKLARTWQPGMLSVVDEQTKRVYDRVPSVPVLGSLFGRPVKEGQTGYVMLFNQAPQLHPGSVVTVVLGGFRQKHVHIQ